MAKTSIIFIIAISLTAAILVPAQRNAIASRPKEVLKDPDGNVISNDLFRDYSLSDPLRKDPFTRTVLADGTVELRLNRNSFEGREAPAFSVTTIDGRRIDGEFIKGKVLVLNFWFIGCPACMEEIPKLNELATRYAGSKDIVFLGLATDTPEKLTGFLKKTPFDYMQSGNAQAAMDLFGVRTFPRNVVVGKDGKIVYWRSTVKAWEQFDGVIGAELGK